MTSEQRLDRLERVAKLFVRAGLRFRRNLRHLDEKIDILIDCQIKNEERVAKSDIRFAKFEERMAESDIRFAKFEQRMAESDIRFAKFEERMDQSDVRFKTFEENTDETLRILSDLMKERRNGHADNPATA